MNLSLIVTNTEMPYYMAAITYFNNSCGKKNPLEFEEHSCELEHAKVLVFNPQNAFSYFKFGEIVNEFLKLHK